MSSRDPDPADTAPWDGESSPSDAEQEELRRQLRSHVQRYCPRWLADQVDDIVQVAWLRVEDARKRSDRYREPGTTFLARVAFCATVDESRRLRRRREVPLDAATERRGSATDEPSRAAHAAEIRQALRKCLLSMRENRSLAVTLYLQGHTTREVARLLGWTVTRTENLVFRGLRDLRRCLAARGLEP